MQQREYSNGKKQEEYNVPLNGNAVFSLENANGGVSEETTPTGRYSLNITSRNLSSAIAGDKTDLKCAFQGIHKILCD